MKRDWFRQDLIHQLVAALSLYFELSHRSVTSCEQINGFDLHGHHLAVVIIFISIGIPRPQLPGHEQKGKELTWELRVGNSISFRCLWGNAAQEKAHIIYYFNPVLPYII